MACVAVMCGARTYTAIADWGRNYDKRFIKALGFTHKKTPCIATLHLIFKKLDIKLLEAKLGEWAAGILSQEQEAVADVDGAGDYVIVVKDNQHNLLDDVMTTFNGPFSSMLDMSSDTTVDAGHGRIEERRLTACDELPHYMDWPGVKQVFMVERSTAIKKTGEYRAEIVYGITSLTSEQADVSRLNSLVRGHWRYVKLKGPAPSGHCAILTKLDSRIRSF